LKNKKPNNKPLLKLDETIWNALIEYQKGRRNGS